MSYRVVGGAGRSRLGEGPTWISARGELLWVDIVGHAIHRLNLDNGKVISGTIDQPVGWVLPIDGSDHLMAGLRDGFAVIDIETYDYSIVGSPEPDRPGNRLNDAKVDPCGRIWAGSKDDTDSGHAGALYRLDPDLSWRRMDDGYGVTNGPAFCPNGRTLYHTDSAARTIYAFDLDDQGQLSNKRIWRTFPERWGYPDGMTTDVQGCLWVAHWGGGRVTRFAPDGELVKSIELPATDITSCCFAGKNLDRMFVTSSAIDCESQPLAGALFEIDPETSGIAPTQFAGDGTSK